MAFAEYDVGNAYDPTIPTERPKTRLWVWLVPVLGVLGGLAWWVSQHQPQIPAQAIEKVGVFTQPVTNARYEPEPAVPARAELDPRVQQLLQDQARQQAELQKQLDDLRKTLAAKQEPAPKPALATHHTPSKPRPHRDMAVWTPEVPKAPGAENVPEPLYWLGAGSWIPCVMESQLHSEVPGYFVVKTRSRVYDTATHQHLLIDQGQKIVGKDEAGDLLFGQERIPTFALTLSRPDGTDQDLGTMPITDELGQNGLTGEVNNHVWRLIWTSLLRGGLQGGQQVAYMGTQSNPATAIGGGMAASLGQTGQQRLGRMQDTRPTIIVAGGDLCNVMLTKAIQLPALQR